jgi:hypothetical protein
MTVTPERTSKATPAWRLSWNANPNRSLAIGLTGAAIGLLIAGFGLFTAKGTSSHAVPAADVALINQRPILVSDFEAQLMTEFSVTVDEATPAQRKQVLEEMIREELFVQRGLELDEPSTDPDTRAALVAAVEQQVVVDATAQAPTDDVLRAYYDKNRDKYSSLGLIRVADYVTTDAAKAAAAQREMAGAGDKAVIAGRLGLKDSGVVAGEEFYFAAAIHLGPQMFAVARTLPAGGVSPVMAGPGGSHVLVVSSNTMPRPRAFEEARAQVYTDYKSDLQKRLQAGEYKYLREKADILVAKAYR